MRVLSVLFIAAVITACSSPDQITESSFAPGNRLLSVHNAAAPEDDGSLEMIVSIDQPSAINTSVDYQTVDGTAVAGEDFTASSGTVVIPAGETKASFNIPLTIDSDIEAAEDFNIVLSNPIGLTLNRSTVTGTVANDDTPCATPDVSSPNPWRDPSRFLINFAHRGGVIDFPENTLYAYYQAAELGAEVLEMDVYQTSDGELVVLHDLTVDRTTNGTGAVGEFTLAELRELDAAYWFVTGHGTPHDRPEEDYTFRGIATGDKAPPPGYVPEDFRIPTLEEALRAFPHELINLELKPNTENPDGNYEQVMADLLIKYGRQTDVMVASFLDSAATNFKAAAPCVTTSIPTGQVAGLVIASQGPGTIPPQPQHSAFQVPPNTSQISQAPGETPVEIVTEDFVNDAHNAGLAVHVWTINDCPEMVRILNLGVDAIMTDRPLLLEQVLAQPEGQWSCDGL